MNRILEHISSDCSGDSPLCWLIRHSGTWHAPDLRVINYERVCLANQKEVTGELQTQQPKLMCSNTTDVWKRPPLLADLSVCFWYGCCAHIRIEHILYSTADIPSPLRDHSVAFTHQLYTCLCLSWQGIVHLWQVPHIYTNQEFFFYIKEPMQFVLKQSNARLDWKYLRRMLWGQALPPLCRKVNT